MWCSVINWLASRTVALAQVILAGGLGVGEGLADDVLKVRVHVGMRARSGTKEKPRLGGPSSRDVRFPVN